MQISSPCSISNALCSMYSIKQCSSKSESCTCLFTINTYSIHGTVLFLAAAFKRSRHATLATMVRPHLPGDRSSHSGPPSHVIGLTRSKRNPKLFRVCPRVSHNYISSREPVKTRHHSEHDCFHRIRARR